MVSNRSGKCVDQIQRENEKKDSTSTKATASSSFHTPNSSPVRHPLDKNLYPPLLKGKLFALAGSKGVTTILLKLDSLREKHPSLYKEAKEIKILFDGLCRTHGSWTVVEDSVCEKLYALLRDIEKMDR